MNTEKAAIARILELEQQLEDAYVKIDLLGEEVQDKEYVIASLKGQLQNLRIDRRYEVA
jgi:hypothetical protein